MVFLPLKNFVPEGEQTVCGLDEVGRGPWAGPLVACALILKKDIRFKGLRDSKKMPAKAREKIFRLLQKKAVYGLGVVSVEEVDSLGIIKANNLAFSRALDGLLAKKGAIRPDFLVVDGRDRLSFPYPHRTIIKGDEKIRVIACASIVAKVTRDSMMADLALQWPQYGFERHKGYGTALHRRALKKYGPCQIHRKSFSPMKAFNGVMP
jgi:ribonuclease HII